MKICGDCKAEKPLDEFHKDRSKKDGLNLYCKRCARARTKKFLASPPRHKDPEGLKTCMTCKTVKPTTEFFNSKDTYDGLTKRCKTCSASLHDTWRRKNLAKMAASQREFRRTNPVRVHDYALKHAYGLPYGSYEKMLEAQGGRCAICDTDTPGGKGKFHVDHCHDTGRVRSLLCHNCNVGIGNFQHDRDLLIKALAYLKNQPKLVV